MIFTLLTSQDGWLYGEFASLAAAKAHAEEQRQPRMRKGWHGTWEHGTKRNGQPNFDAWLYRVFNSAGTEQVTLEVDVFAGQHWRAEAMPTA